MVAFKRTRGSLLIRGCDHPDYCEDVRGVASPRRSGGTEGTRVIILLRHLALEHWLKWSINVRRSFIKSLRAHSESDSKGTLFSIQGSIVFPPKGLGLRTPLPYSLLFTLALFILLDHSSHLLSIYYPNLSSTLIF